MIRASRQGAKAGCPVAGYNSTKSSSRSWLPSRSRKRMINVPLGLTFQASCAVSAGIGAIGCGYIDIGSLLFLGFILLLLSYYYFFHSPAESAGGSPILVVGAGGAAAAAPPAPTTKYLRAAAGGEESPRVESRFIV